MTILDSYVTTAPSNQNLIDIFKGEWSSKFPANSGLTSTPGQAALFEDARIQWLSDSTGGFAGKRILELGPLEAGHTYMMHEGGAKSITAVEANSRSLLKCLCVKEIFNLNRAQFLYGDALEYMTACHQKFDVCVASGILYHMNRPIEFIRNIAQTSDTIFLWTHYYDEAALRARGAMFNQFGSLMNIELNGHAYTVVKRNYGEALNWAGFCGGPASSAMWLTRDSLFRILENIGFNVEAVGFDHADHPNGPALALVARRK